MEKNTQRKINIEPIYTFLTEDTNPRAFTQLLDSFLLEHLSMLVRLQKLDTQNNAIHENTEEFILYIKLLRDMLPYCEIPKGENEDF